MLLVIDVGNTNTVFGAYRGTELVHHFRVETTSGRTADEYGILIKQLFGHAGIELSQLQATICSSVVPPMQFGLEQMVKRYLGHAPLFVGPGVRTGMPILYDNPREVGADRIVNSVAAYERWRQGLVIVDFGTATTFDCVDARGDYIGGAIAPGFGISAEALTSRTAKLPRVEVERPARAIGTNTVESMQSGLFWGYVGLVDGLARRCKDELRARDHLPADAPIPCIATGGLSNLLGRACDTVDAVDDDLTLQGLRRLWELNPPASRRA